jgi:predicted ATP-grasp superfamily ATP-dependent carboligase
MSLLVPKIFMHEYIEINPRLTTRYIGLRQAVNINLAETASDQAASLEEISSSLEEMTVITKQSAETGFENTGRQV